MTEKQIFFNAPIELVPPGGWECVGPRVCRSAAPVTCSRDAGIWHLAAVACAWRGWVPLARVRSKDESSQPPTRPKREDVYLAKQRERRRKQRLRRAFARSNYQTVRSCTRTRTRTHIHTAMRATHAAFATPLPTTGWMPRCADGHDVVRCATRCGDVVAMVSCSSCLRSHRRHAGGW